jgi:APA family basic amino acid/polyamine antiporter
MNQLFAKKSLQQLLASPEEGHQLKRALGAGALVSLGVGAIIGAGIFVLTGQAAAQHAGPAIVLSFVLAGIGCAFAGLCYAEMASMIPIAGSAYTYSYATMGEFLAWIIGWDLVLEYSLGAATVAVGWSGYVVGFLKDFGIIVPPEISAAYGTKLIFLPNELIQTVKSLAETGWVPLNDSIVDKLREARLDAATFQQTTSLFNLPAVVIVLAVTSLLVVGIKESTLFNNIVVVIKVGVLCLFLGAGAYFLFHNPERFTTNWAEFIPKEEKFGVFGWSGILTGAGVIFFAYIGFDAVSTAAQEAKNPQRDMPIGILGSLLVCTVFYILVAAVLTGLVNYRDLNVASPVALGIDATGFTWLKPVVKIGAIAGLSSVILVMLLAQPRIFYTMSRDGLLPKFFSIVHPRFQTPVVTTLITGLAVATVAALAPVGILGHLVSIGTLLAFVLVCAGVWVLRYTRPEIHRPFKTPAVPLVPLLGILVCMAQMVSLPFDTWTRLLIWMAAGILIYFCYGYWHSKLRISPGAASAPASNG